MTLTELFTNIANAIRTKRGSQGSIVALDFPEEINKLFTDTDKIVEGTITSLTAEQLKNITKVRPYAFNECSLRSIELPSTVTSIGNNAFFGCTYLTTCNIPSGVTKIEANTFNSCLKLENMELPNSITEIGENAFNFCASLNTNIPTSITKIGNSSFHGTAITSVTLPNTLIELGSNVFSNCDELTSIYWNNLEAIPTGTFQYCDKLANIDISNVNVIGNSAFANCTALTQSIDLSNRTVTIGNNAFASSAITGLKVSADSQMAQSAFWSCSSLVNLTLPRSYTIATYSHAFFNLPNLTNLTIYSDTMMVYDSYLESTNLLNGHIYVPADLVNTYKLDLNWSRFASVITAITE